MRAPPRCAPRDSSTSRSAIATAGIWRWPGASSRPCEGALNAMIVSRIGAQRAQHFVDNWRQLVVVLERGELRPGHLKAAKPA